MFKKLAYAGAFVGAVAAATVVGCGGDDSTSRTYDFSMTQQQQGGDMAGNPGNDAHVTSYFATNPHDIDTAQIGDANMLNTNFTPVSVSGLIVLASPTGFSSSFNGTSGAGCRYEVWAQDPVCSAGPPCGIILETQSMSNPGGAGAFCPFSDELDDPLNVLKETRQGDVVTAQGVIDTFPKAGSAVDGGTPTTLNAHEIELDTLTSTTDNGPLPAATVVTDTSPSMFVPYSGAGWTKYEGMYIKLVPPSGTAKFTTTLNTSSSFADTCPALPGVKTNGSFTTAPGGAYFADTYAGFYLQKDAGEATNCWPTNGLMFSSISGIVSTSFGGSILPANESDFQQ